MYSTLLPYWMHHSNSRGSSLDSWMTWSYKYYQCPIHFCGFGVKYILWLALLNEGLNISCSPLALAELTLLSRPLSVSHPELLSLNLSVFIFCIICVLNARYCISYSFLFSFYIKHFKIALHLKYTWPCFTKHFCFFVLCWCDIMFLYVETFWTAEHAQATDSMNGLFSCGPRGYFFFPNRALGHHVSHLPFSRTVFFPLL